jgi:hypothetical protein
MCGARFGAFALVGVLRIYRVRHVERLPAIQWPARSVSATNECYHPPGVVIWEGRDRLELLEQRLAQHRGAY